MAATDPGNSNTGRTAVSIICVVAASVKKVSS